MGVEIFTAWNSFLYWLKNLPGLRAICLPKFGNDALTCFTVAMGFALLFHAGEIGCVVAWLLFTMFGLPVIVSSLIFLGRIPKQNLAVRQEMLTSFFAPIHSVAVTKAVNTLPHTMLLVWAIVHLCGNHAIWLNRICILVWLNYFAVGCAVVLRRGVDDLVRSRRARV